LVTDLYEGGDAKAMLSRAGVNLIVLLALKRGDLNAWASSVGIGVARGQN